MYRLFIKRILDVGVALVAFIVLLPFFISIAVLIPLLTGEQPFFFQHRPGKRGKIFRLIKFKTMTGKKDASGELLPDVQRTTSFGSFLRKSSLDEIPQLLNVIKGDMSLVGPRPLLVEYLPLYNSVQQKRHDVLPGITGWAQVNGRNAISWEEKFRYDVWYAEHVSFMLDVKILFRTVSKIFRSQDVNAGAQVTMEKFTGSKL